jgi:argininosuccinate lyase
MEDFKKIDKRITNDVLKVLSLKNSLESRDSYGGTSPKVVKKALKYAEKKWLK